MAELRKVGQVFKGISKEKLHDGFWTNLCGIYCGIFMLSVVWYPSLFGVGHALRDD